MTNDQLDIAAAETCDRLRMLCIASRMPPHEAVDFLLRVHEMLGRELEEMLAELTMN